MEIVILGGGIAGTTAAEELRKRNKDAHIVILGQEEHPLYSRVLLPHYVLGKIPREKVFLKQPHWYADNNIEFLCGIRVTAIDVKNRFVATHDGREFSYDKLLLASGGELNLLSSDVRGVSYLRTLGDADHLCELLRERKKGDAAVVYGSGFIALEYVNIFAHFGHPTTVVMRGSGFWSSLLSAVSQDVLRDVAERNGVTLVCNEPMPNVVGAKAIEAVELTNGRKIPATLLGVGIGTHAETTLFTDADIAMNRGILADEYLATNIPDVFVAGDAAEFFDGRVNRKVQYGNWHNAFMQGRTVAANMLGERTAFLGVSQYATHLFDTSVVFIGDVDRAAADSVIEEEALTPPLTKRGQGGVSNAEYFIRAGKLVGAVLIGDVSNRAKLVAAIGKEFGTL